MSSEEALKKEFLATQGESAWRLDPGWSALLHLDPEIFSASMKILNVPKQKKHLPAKYQSLLSLAVDAASTHLYLPGVRTHVAAALQEGASVAEIMEILELTSTLGIHACNIGVPLLVEVMKEAGLYDSHPMAQPFDEQREKLKADFTKNRGYWHVFWEDFLRLDPEFFDAYLEFSSTPWYRNQNGVKDALEPKLKEMVYCAFDAAATHLYVPGLKLHMKNVLAYGGTPEEIMEVLEIATALSLHTGTACAPIVKEEVERFKAGK